MKFKETDYYATFDTKPFTEGTYRNCYKGIIKKKMENFRLLIYFPMRIV